MKTQTLLTFFAIWLALATLGAATARADPSCDRAAPPFNNAVVEAVSLTAAGRPDDELTGAPLASDATQYQFTVEGVTFLFESFSGVAVSAGESGLMSFGFEVDSALILTINPPVTAVGFDGVESDGCPGGSFSGTLSSESVFCGVPCPGTTFTGAYAIGDIGSVDVSRAASVFVLPALYFVPPGVTPTDTADLGLTKSVACGAGASSCRVVANDVLALNGEPFLFSIEVDNNGPDAATNAFVTDFLPGGITVTEVPPGNVQFPSAGLATLLQPDLPDGNTLAIGLAATTPEDRQSFSCGYTLLNAASATSDASDPWLAEVAGDGLVNRNLDAAVVRFDNNAVAGVSEICGNGVDDNCDGRVDCADQAQCNCRPTLPLLPGGDPSCFGGFQEALVEFGLVIPSLCTSDTNPAPNHACMVPRGACGGVTVPAFCCDAATWSNPANTFDIASSCDVGVPGCAPFDPNFKTAVPGVDLQGYGYTAAGQTIEYTVHYENIGDADAHDVVVLDVLDLDLDDSTLSLPEGMGYDPERRLLQWLDPVVPPGEPRSVAFSVEVRADAPPGTRVRNVGTIIFPDAVPPTRIDTNFVEHVVPDPGLALEPDFFISGCTETAPGSGDHTVTLVNDGPGFAYFTSVEILDPPAAVTVTGGIAAAFAHPDDLESLPTVIAFAATTSGDTVSFTTETPADPCAALRWGVDWVDIGGQAFSVEVQTAADDDVDAVADAADNCPLVANATQVDADADELGDACDLCPDTPAEAEVDADGCAASQLDADADGVSDADDLCPDTPAEAEVDAHGCAASQLDADADGVSDAADQCPDTPAQTAVNALGCSASQRDSDADGVSDAADLCPGTPAEAVVDANGCSASQRDADADGVVDSVDLCPDTPAATEVDVNGCAAGQRDSDGDGVSDAEDRCPESPSGAAVGPDGCASVGADSDGDGVLDADDRCPGTASSATVDAVGCSRAQLDLDGDGVSDADDRCPATPSGAPVDSQGCATTQLDLDGDGVVDAEDLCPGTPANTTVRADGCAVEEDDGASGCGCSTAPGGEAPALALLVLLAFRRRAVPTPGARSRPARRGPRPNGPGPRAASGSGASVASRARPSGEPSPDD